MLPSFLNEDYFGSYKSSNNITIKKEVLIFRFLQLSVSSLNGVHCKKNNLLLVDLKKKNLLN